MPPFLGAGRATPEQIQQIRDQYHLDDPLLTRYWLWLQDAVHLDFGRSIKSDTSVFAAIEGRLPITLELTFFAIIIVVLIGVPLGMISGIRQGTMIDRISTSTSIVGLSAPVFATGIFLLYVFGVYLGWFPSFGGGDGGIVDRAHHLFLPAIALGGHDGRDRR